MERNSSDTAWKEILESYFQDFVECCLPSLYQMIDWKKDWSTLDKELLAVTKDGITGTRLLDKLFKVFLKDGREQWILIHVEIQGAKDKDFTKRMFTYAYRIYDRYQKPIVSCAVLTDEDESWRPHRFEMNMAGSCLSLEFLVVKLIDYRAMKAELEASTNPFASVILIQLTALDSKQKPDQERKIVKFALTKRLYKKGYSKTEIKKLYLFIDWLIKLPKEFEEEYLNKVYRLEESKKMTYISSAERFGIEKGIQQGMQKGIQQGKQEGEALLVIRLLTRKFGQVPPRYLKRIKQADAKQLLLLAERVLDAKTIKEIFE